MLQLLISALVNLFVFGIATGAFYWLFFQSSRPGPDLPKPLTQDEVHKPSVSDIPPTGERNHSTSNVRTTTKSSMTYRLQGIPAGTGKADVRSLLRKAWEIPEATEVTVHSLAADPHSPEKTIATVSFSKVPELLQMSKQTEWVCKVNNELELVLDTHFRGFTPLHSNPDSECFLDCIAVSGLGGHAFGSFKSKNSSFMWLRDALPKDLPQSRIFLYGYDAASVNSKSFENITDLGIELQRSINRIRPSKRNLASHLVLIGHSLGGLVAKQAVINMYESQSEDDKTNYSSLRAVLFFAVPNLGMKINSFIPMVKGKPNEDFVRSLNATSESLRRQKSAFDNASKLFSKYWYYETMESPTAELVDSKWSMTGPNKRLVDPHSATNGWLESSEQDRHFVEPINHTHSEIVKFPHQEDSHYVKVSEDLKRIKGGIPKSMNGRILFPLTDTQSECVRSLAIENQESRKRSIELLPGTCEWIETHTVFQEWEESRTGILWIRGQPGSGKSSLMKYLADTLDRKPPNIANQIVVSFFFNGTGLEVHRSLFGFYSALLNQLLPEIPPSCHKMFEKYSQDRSRLGSKFSWEMQEVKDFLSSILSEATSMGIQTIILADALDEAGQSNAMELMQFFRSIENIAKETTGGIDRFLKICFSCRPYPIIVGPNHEMIIDVDQHNGEDLSVFVRNKIKPDPSIRIQDEFLTEVQDEIIRKTGRTFQWANLMIKEVGRMLTERDTMSDIQEQISTTPLDLHQFYRRLVLPTILEDNGNKKQNLRRQALTLKLFQWLCFSKGPLTLATIQHALVLGPGEPDIAHPSEHRDFQPLEAMAIIVTKLSRGLVEIRTQHSGRDGMQEIVQFTHHSVYDFLLETGLADLSGSEIASLEPNARFSKVKGLGHLQISRACIQATVMEDTRTFVKTHLRLTGRKRKVLVVGSATRHINDEMRTSGLPACCYSFARSLVGNDCNVAELLAPDNKTSVSQPRLRFEQRRSFDFGTILRKHSMQMIPVACYAAGYLFQHLAALESLGWDSSEVLDDYKETNLAHVWEKLWLLLRNEDPLMSLLSTSGVIGLLRLCLRQDARSWSIKDRWSMEERRSIKERRGRRTPLHHVIQYNEDDVLKFLIQEELERRCIDIDLSDEAGRTPLHYAIEFGKEEAARVLIQETSKRGTVNLNRLNNGGRTLLDYAVELGRKETVQNLIREAVDVDSPDLQGRTPIFIAALYDRADEMRYLLRTGVVNVERKDWRGETPLAIAASCGHTDIASILLEYGASVESKDDYGRTPLFQAVRRPDTEMTRYLVEEASAEVNVLDNQGRSVLSHAAEEGGAPVIEYILGIAPTQLEIEDKRGKLPIIYAIESRRREAFEFLKARIDQHEEALLISIARSGGERSLKYVLEHGGHFSSRTLQQALEVVHGSKRPWSEELFQKICEKQKQKKNMKRKMEGIKRLMEQKRNRP